MMNGPLGDELSHLIRQISSHEVVGYHPQVFGHIATYDPKTHMVRALLPSFRNEDGNPVLTPWIKLITPGGGDGWGLQVYPVGGATIENPTAGEQVEISWYLRTAGVMAATAMFHNDLAPPPATKLPDDAPLLPGEMLVYHKSGSYTRYHANGDVEQNTSAGTGKVIVITQGDVTVTTQGSATVMAKQDVTVLATDGKINLGSAAPILAVKLSDGSNSTKVMAV